MQEQDEDDVELEDPGTDSEKTPAALRNDLHDPALIESTGNAWSEVSGEWSDVAGNWYNCAGQWNGCEGIWQNCSGEWVNCTGMWTHCSGQWSEEV